MAAFTGRDNTTVNVSVGSTKMSSTRLIRTVLVVSPGAKVTGCALGSKKSSGAVADPLRVS